LGRERDLSNWSPVSLQRTSTGWPIISWGSPMSPMSRPADG
jgi:hypothetical protein